MMVDGLIDAISQLNSVTTICIADVKLWYKTTVATAPMLIVIITQKGMMLIDPKEKILKSMVMMKGIHMKMVIGEMAKVMTKGENEEIKALF